jgi:hypothetical protein
MENFKSFPAAHTTLGKSADVPGVRPCFEVFEGKAGILLARGGRPTQPYSTENFTDISLRKKVIYLFSHFGPDNSPVRINPPLGLDAGRTPITQSIGKQMGCSTPHFVIFKAWEAQILIRPATLGYRADNRHTHRNRGDRHPQTLVGANWGVIDNGKMKKSRATPQSPWSS